MGCKLIQFAEPELLWVAEVSPDAESANIMAVLRSDYSHNAIHFGGMIWHADTPGVVREFPGKALKDCVVVRRRTVKLECSPDVFLAYLEGELGKKYAVAQNYGHVEKVLRWLPKWATRWIWKHVSNGGTERNCSEFVFAAINKYLPEHSPMRRLYPPNRVDRITPVDTEHIYKPERCYILGNQFR